MIVHTPKVFDFSSEPFNHPAVFINQLSYNQVARSLMLLPKLLGPFPGHKHIILYYFCCMLRRGSAHTLIRLKFF